MFNKKTVRRKKILKVYKVFENTSTTEMYKEELRFCSLLKMNLRERKRMGLGEFESE